MVQDDAAPSHRHVKQLFEYLVRYADWVRTNKTMDTQLRTALEDLTRKVIQAHSEGPKTAEALRGPQLDWRLRKDTIQSLMQALSTYNLKTCHSALKPILASYSRVLTDEQRLRHSLATLNHKGDFAGTIRVYEQSVTEEQDISPGCLSQALLAYLALKWMGPALSIRKQFLKLHWHDPRARETYVNGLVVGFEKGCLFPELEEVLFAYEVKQLQGPLRRKILDAILSARVRTGRPVKSVLAWYGLDGQDTASAVAELTRNSDTVNWLLRSQETTPNFDTLKSYWDSYLHHRADEAKAVPAFVVESFVHGCNRLYKDEWAVDALAEALDKHFDAFPPGPLIKIDTITLDNLLKYHTIKDGIQGAERILEFHARVKDLVPTEHAAFSMINALDVHYCLARDAYHECTQMALEKARSHFTGRQFTYQIKKPAKEVSYNSTSPIPSEVPAASTWWGTRFTPSNLINKPSLLDEYRRYIDSNDRKSGMSPQDFYMIMVKFGIFITPERFHEITAYYLTRKNLQAAIDTFVFAKALEVTPSKDMWCDLIIQVVTEPPGTSVSIGEVLGQLRDKGVEPPLYVYPTVVRHMFQLHMFTQSATLLRFPLRHADPVTYDAPFISVVYLALVRSKNPQEALEFLDSMTVHDTFKVDLSLLEQIKWGRRSFRNNPRLYAKFSETLAHYQHEMSRRGAGPSVLHRLKRWLPKTLIKYWTGGPITRLAGSIRRDISSPNRDRDPHQ